jgi:hypothetical protein
LSRIDPEVADQLRRLRAVAVRQLVEDARFGQRDFGVQVFRLDQSGLPRIEAVEPPQHRHVRFQFFRDLFSGHLSPRVIH